MREFVNCSFDSGISEMFFALYSKDMPKFSDEAQELVERYLHLAKNSETLLLRFHLSDIVNQSMILRRILWENNLDKKAIFVGQRPLEGGHIALEAWNFSGKLKNYKFEMYKSKLIGGTKSSSQMQKEFEFLENEIATYGNINDNIIRTWIYCRDIDNNYGGLVSSRRDYFTKIGLTEKTHYISSTGIEGKAEESERLVRMDSLGIFGQEQQQIEFMHAPEHLSPTNIYGVTFERGTRFISQNRSHYFLSGTASIDKYGEIVHPNNVELQTERMLENVEALLVNHNGKLEDFKQAIVYLRDPKDYSKISRIIEKKLSNECVCLMLDAPVCRPGWLVELDGIALNNVGNSNFKLMD